MFHIIKCFIYTYKYIPNHNILFFCYNNLTKNLLLSLFFYIFAPNTIKINNTHNELGLEISWN